MATKEQLMAALAAQKEKSQPRGNTQTKSGGDNASYPFWNIDVGTSSTVRFLPDKDPNNTFFWVKREVIRLPFDGVEGGDYPTSKQVSVTVPCVDMWGDACPIMAATRPWWKDPAKEALARLYWKKKSYIFQGFVVASAFSEDNQPENPIRRFVINPSIFEIIEKSLMDPEMEDLPIDYVNGVDFRIHKTKKGDYSNYSTSDWSRKTRSLSETELLSVEQHGLWNLADYQGKRPDATETDMIKAMFEDSVAGRPFDMESYGKYYRPYGTNNSNDESVSQVNAVAARQAATKAAALAPTPVEESYEEKPRATERTERSTPAAETVSAASGGSTNAQEILERIKNRTMQR